MRASLLLAGLTLASLVPMLQARAQDLDARPVYRLYHDVGGEHLLTASRNEVRTLRGQDWSYEGVEFYVADDPGPGLVPLYRFDREEGGHFYTTSRARGRRMGGIFEGVLGYISARRDRGLAPLHDLYDAESGMHLYTANPRAEAPHGYESAGVLGYVVPGRR